MAFRPVRAFQPRLRTQMDTRFCSFPETTGTVPCLSSKLHPEDGRVRQKKRREDPEDGRVRQKKRREDPEEGRVRQKKRREDPEEGRVRQKKRREDPEEGSVRHKRREDPEEGRVRQKKRREDPEEGRVRHKRREDPEECRVRHKRREEPEECRVRQKKRREDPEEGSVRQERREDPEDGRVKHKRREDPEECRVRHKRREEPEECRVRQKKRREDREEGGVRHKRREDPEDGRVRQEKRREDPDEGPNPFKRTCLNTYSRAHFEALYGELEQLGGGGYGSVFAGSRKEDCLPVAIKHIPMEKVKMLSSYLTSNGKRTAFPLEVTLMLKAAGEPGSEGPGAAVHLLDWFQLDQELILVQERPVPFVDLLTYMGSNRSQLQELRAKMILHQVLKGVVGLHSRGVLHCDIKPENLLIETGSDTPRVRIIDLGCGSLLHNGVYSQISGTALYTPPEWFRQGSYRAGPMTVWQVGVVLYNMLTGLYPFKTTEEILLKELRIQFEMSSNCRDFLRRCLTKRPLSRPTLENLLLHPWLQ